MFLPTQVTLLGFRGRPLFGCAWSASHRSLCVRGVCVVLSFVPGQMEGSKDFGGLSQENDFNFDGFLTRDSDWSGER